MISGTQVLARLSDNVRQDDINRRGLLVDRLRQVSAKLDDIDRKIARCQSFAQDIYTGTVNVPGCVWQALRDNGARFDKLQELRSKTEANRLSLVALMEAGRFVQPTTRSTSRVIKSDLERKQGKVYSQYELSGREGKRFLVDTGMKQAPSQVGKPVKKWTDTRSNVRVLEKGKPYDPRPIRDQDGEFTIPYPPVKK